MHETRSQPDTLGTMTPAEREAALRFLVETIEGRRLSPLQRLERMITELWEALRRSADRTAALRRAKVRQELQASRLRRLQERRAPQRQLRVSNPAANLRQAQHLRAHRPRRSP